MGSASAKMGPHRRHLFLHHFEGSQLDPLLAAVAAPAAELLLRRLQAEASGADPLAGSHLVGAIGANAVTREDAVLSVHAGFRDQEIGALWPRAGSAWRTRQSAAGMFSHCFSAQRTSIDRWTE